MATETPKLYCSLDIETSGFDPLKNEILEVGFVLFEFVKGKVKIKEEYTRVFKPSGEVPANILGLTGIKQEELDNADLFMDHRQELQDKLRDAVIVGHNVIFDIRFLESVGIKFSGQVVDTLDLVQFILPAHHSYNLENLAHYFEVEHKDAHRALADAKAALVVLEKLLGKFGSFAKSLRQEIISIGARQNFVWTEIFEDVTPSAKPKKISAGKIKAHPFKANAASGHPSLALDSQTIYDLPVGTDCVDYLANALGKTGHHVLLVVPKTNQAIKLWNSGLAEAVFPPELLFDEQKFSALKNKNNPTPEEAKFTLKVLVWQATNWQNRCIFDLNLSFFGGQFKNYITGGQIEENTAAPLVCCSLESLSSLANSGLYQNRQTIIVGLNEFESFISSSLSVKASWSYITYLLKTFYNPESGAGNVKVKEQIIAALARADLFFGLVNMLLKSDQEFQYYKIDENTLQGDALQKIQQAAKNFASLLLESNEVLQSDPVKMFAENLQSFFSVEDNQVKWIELSPVRCVLQSAPIDISGSVRNVLNNFSFLSFADSLGSQKLMDYFVARLGLAEFRIQALSTKQPGQADLFGRGQTILCKISAQTMPDQELEQLIMGSVGKAAALFGNATQVKSFYEQYYPELQKQFFVIAQNNAGGSNKMFRNFYNYYNSLLLATGRSILKHLTGSSSIDPVEVLPVKTLIVGHLPFEIFTHPYQEAVAARFPNAFEDYSLPRAIYNFHALLKFFHTGQLERLYIFDPKLGKEYGKAFREYLEKIPNIKFV